MRDLFRAIEKKGIRNDNRSKKYSYIKIFCFIQIILLKITLCVCVSVSFVYIYLSKENALTLLIINRYLLNINRYFPYFP